MVRRIAFAVCALALTGQAVHAQSIADIDRTQGREAALAAIRARQAATGQGRPYGAPRVAPPATIEDTYATVTAPPACAPNMQMQIRLKQNRPITDLARPDYYMANLNSALNMSMLRMRMAGECSTALLNVYGPAGQMVAQDRLTYDQFGGWKSANAQQILQQRAMATPGADSFGPGGVASMTDTLAARQQLAEQARRACFDQQQKASEALRLERQRRGIQGYGPADVAPGSPGWQITQDLNACVERAKSGTNAVFNNLDKAAADFAAKQPVSYDGLRAIKEAKSKYSRELGGPTGRGGSYENQQALGRINGILDGRAKEIETALRPQIVADMNKQGGTGLVDDLFGLDRAREQAYAVDIYPPSYVSRLPKRTDGSKPFFQRAGDVSKSQRETAQASAFRTWTEPTETEIGLAMIRALTFSGGRQLSPNVATVPGALNRIGFDGLDGMANMKMQMFDVRKGRCAKAQDGYRCDFTLYARMLAGGAYGGDALGMMSMMGVDADKMTWGVHTQTLFVPSRDGWRVPEREAAIASGQATQMQQLGDVATKVVQSGTSAMQVMTDQFKGPDQNSPEARREREDRERRGNTDF